MYDLSPRSLHSTQITCAKMIMDERLSKIESLVDANLNEDSAPAKVVLLLVSLMLRI